MKKIVITIVFLAIINVVGSGKVSAEISTQKYNKKVYLLIFNPDVGDNQTIVQKYKWNNPEEISNQIINFFQETSEGRLNFTISQLKTIKDFTYLVDGYKYNAIDFHQCLLDGSKCHQPQQADYKKIVNENNICSLLNKGEIDELWMWGGPYFGFYESQLVGPNPYWYNSPGIINTNCNKLIPVMGFNYERGLSEAIEDFGHRTESTLLKLYKGWTIADPQTNWDYFSTNYGSTVVGTSWGCGNVHYPHNGEQDYDWSNKTVKSTYCDEFLKDIKVDKTKTKQYNCDIWGCNGLGFFSYWYKHMPRFTGSTDGISNDWWKYISDPNAVFILEESKCNPECRDKKCGESDGCGGKCKGYCQDIPNNICKDENTLLEYSISECTSTFKCDISSVEKKCEFGCSNNKCNISEVVKTDPVINGDNDAVPSNKDNLKKSNLSPQVYIFSGIGVLGLIVLSYYFWKKRKFVSTSDLKETEKISLVNKEIETEPTEIKKD